VLTRDIVVFLENAFGLISEIIDAVNGVTSAFDEMLGVINAVMLEARNVQHVVARKAISVDKK